MARADVLKVLYAKTMSPLEFHFDSLVLPSMFNYITPMDTEQLHEIATSREFNSRTKVKYKMIDEIMTRRGFFKFRAGTNRVIYRHLEDPRFVAKIATDRVGVHDNPAEFRNQRFLKPFVTKVFEVSPCGTVAFVEKVEPISNREEFLNIAGDVFEVLVNNILGLYALDDIGTDFFMNWGVRLGFGPVLLDFPYVFEIDGNKLHCNLPEIDSRGAMTGRVCDGEIDYDEGFNYLVCEKCGKKYSARDLRKAAENKLIMLKGGQTNMSFKVAIKQGDKIIGGDFQRASETIRKPKPNNSVHYDIKRPSASLKGKIVVSTDTEAPAKETKPPIAAVVHEPSAIAASMNSDIIADESVYMPLKTVLDSLPNDVSARVGQFMLNHVYDEIISDFNAGAIRVDKDATDIKVKDTFNFKDKGLDLRGTLFIKTNGEFFVNIYNDTGFKRFVKGNMFIDLADDLIINDDTDDEEEEDEETSSEETTSASTAPAGTSPSFLDNLPLQSLKRMCTAEIDDDTYNRCQMIMTYYSPAKDLVVTIAKTNSGTDVIDKIVTHGTFDQVFNRFMEEFAEYEDRREEIYNNIKAALTNTDLAAEYDSIIGGAHDVSEVSTETEESHEERIQRTDRHLQRRKPDEDTLNSF